MKIRDKHKQLTNYKTSTNPDVQLTIDKPAVCRYSKCSYLRKVYNVV